MKNSLLMLLLFSIFMTNTVEAKQPKAKEPIHKLHQKVSHKVVKSVNKHKHNNAVGMASYYADKFHGRKTASGEIFNQHALTAAHRTLPLKSKVKVTNLRNHKSVTVKINDRGPWSKDRIMDLSKKAANVLQISGVEKVSLAVVN